MPKRLIPFLLLIAGCTVRHEAGPARTDSVDIDRGKAEMVRAELHMGAGELRIGGGARKLLEAHFTYNVPEWKPVVQYDASSFRGHLTVEQPVRTASLGHSKYSWDLRFNDDTPLDLQVKFGAGEGRLNLGSLYLRSLEVHMGAGKLDVDLLGTPRRSYEVNIRGGVGEATIHVPKGVGISAEAMGGIGDFRVRGLQKRNGHYRNDAYDHAKTTIRLDIRGGIGSIDLRAE